MSQMLDMNQIPKEFKGKNIVYHYSKSQTVIEEILFKKRIRLSPRSTSNDPIEKAIINSSWTGVNSDETMENKGNKMLKELRERQEMLRQVCFCKNNTKIKKDEIEFYGFFKPRMWDQYGDNYKGICLVFNKDKLIEESKVKLKGKIKYIKVGKFKNKMDLSLDLNVIKREGYDKYIEYVKEFQDKMFLRKLKDYRDENEFRIGVFSEEGYEYLNIEKSIVGIVVFHKNINDYTFEMVKKYSKEFKIPLLFLNLGSELSITLGKEWVKRMENGELLHDFSCKSCN